MAERNPAVEAFLEAWAPEFGRAVEMFRGEQPVLSWAVYALDAEQPSAEPAEISWWQQPLEVGERSSLWIGTPSKSWSELSAGLADSEKECKQQYFEMLGQSLKGAAHVLSGSRTAPATCRSGSEGNDAPSPALAYGSLTVTLNGRRLPPILAGFEPAFASWLTPPPDAPTPTPEKPAHARGVTAGLRPLLERLIDLQLPVSIVLGRAVLPVRDVLKLTAGSLVELDRRVGDHVEIIVHNVVVARGEVVSIMGNYGVRVQEVISREDRMALQASARKQRNAKASAGVEA